jgi:hypothetical protein
MPEKCKGKTKTGAPCGNKVVPPKKLCGVHTPKAVVISKPPAKVAVKKGASAITKKQVVVSSSKRPQRKAALKAREINRDPKVYAAFAEFSESDDSDFKQKTTKEEEEYSGDD